MHRRDREMRVQQRTLVVEISFGHPPAINIPRVVGVRYNEHRTAERPPAAWLFFRGESGWILKKIQPTGGGE